MNITLGKGRSDRPGGRRGRREARVGSAEVGAVVRAEQEYQRALALQPDQTDALKGMAEICRRRGQTERAIEYLLRASQSAPFHESIYSRLASFYRKLGRTREANQETAKFEKQRAIKNESSLAHQRSQQ